VKEPRRSAPRPCPAQGPTRSTFEKSEGNLGLATPSCAISRKLPISRWQAATYRFHRVGNIGVALGYGPDRLRKRLARLGNWNQPAAWLDDLDHKLGSSGRTDPAVMRRYGVAEPLRAAEGTHPRGKGASTAKTLAAFIQISHSPTRKRLLLG